MVAAVWETALVLVAGLVAVEGILCQRGKTWWSAEQSVCIECTKCESPMVILHPCERYKDTICASISNLNIDWSWLRGDRPHNHRKHHQRADIEDDFENPVNRSESAFDDEDYDDTEVQSNVNNEYFLAFTSNEDDNDYTDWQHILLFAAISSCILFFVIVGVCSVYYARQWRILKENLEADVEGLSTQISLMMASAENNNCRTSAGPVNRYNSIHCSYLEQLLVGKSKDRPLGPGNVYIQENKNYWL